MVFYKLTSNTCDKEYMSQTGGSLNPLISERNTRVKTLALNVLNNRHEHGPSRMS